MSSVKVSVIVVSYNRAEDLRLCLEAIFESTYPSLEVIVVDNASSDDAADVAMSFSGVKLVRNHENLGFAAGNNLGLEHASGEYVALVNNDAVVEPSWFGKLVEFLDAHPRAAAVGGRQYQWNEQNPLRDRQNQFYGYSELLSDGRTPAVLNPPDELREVPLLSGAAVVVRRAAIEDVGAPFLDPLYFMYYEETDFFARAIRKGWRLYYLGSAACWHRVRGGETRAPYDYHYYIHRNRLLLAHRHFDDAALAQVIRTARWRAFGARIRTLLGVGFERSEALRGCWDAWVWARRQTRLLADERARFGALEGSYTQALTAMAQRSAASRSEGAVASGLREEDADRPRP